MKALPCTILAIDPGAASGWAIMGERPDGSFGLCDSGSVKGACRTAVKWAASRADFDAMPLVVVGERWMSRMDRRRGGYTQQGLGAAWGRWLQLLEDAEHPKRRTLRVDLMTWRRALFGHPLRRRSEEWKLLAVARANHHTETMRGDMSHDEAEAICIGEFAMRWDKVRDVLPKRHLQKHGWAV